MASNNRASGHRGGNSGRESEEALQTGDPTQEGDGLRQAHQQPGCSRANNRWAKTEMQRRLKNLQNIQELGDAFKSQSTRIMGIPDVEREQRSTGS